MRMLKENISQVFYLSCALLFVSVSINAWERYSVSGDYYASRADRMDELFLGEVEAAAEKIRQYSLRDDVASILFQAELEKRPVSGHRFLDFLEKNPVFSNLELADARGRVVSAVSLRRKTLAGNKNFRGLKKGSQPALWLDRDSLQIGSSIRDYYGKFKGALVASYYPPPSLLESYKNQRALLHKLIGMRSGILILPFAKDRLILYPDDVHSVAARSALLQSVEEYHPGDSFFQTLNLDGNEFRMYSGGKSGGFAGTVFYIEENRPIYRSLAGILLVVSGAMTLFSLGFYFYEKYYRSLVEYAGNGAGNGEIRMELMRQGESIAMLLEKTQDLMFEMGNRGLRLAPAEAAGKAAYVDVETDERRYEKAKDVSAAGDAKISGTRPLKSGGSAAGAEKTAAADVPRANGGRYIELQKVDREFIYLNPFQSEDFQEAPDDLEVMDYGESVLKDPYLFDEPSGGLDLIARKDFSVQTATSEDAEGIGNLARKRIFTEELRSVIGEVARSRSTQDAGSKWKDEDVNNLYTSFLANIDSLQIPEQEWKSRLVGSYLETESDQDVITGFLSHLANVLQAQSAVILYYDSILGCLKSEFTCGLSPADALNLYFPVDDAFFSSTQPFKIFELGDSDFTNIFFTKRFSPSMLAELKAAGVMRIEGAYDKIFIVSFYYQSFPADGLPELEEMLGELAHTEIDPFLPLLKNRAGADLLAQYHFDFNHIMVGIFRNMLHLDIRDFRIIKITLHNFFTQSEPEASRKNREIGEILHGNIQKNELIAKVSPNRYILAVFSSNEVNLLLKMEEINQGYFEVRKEIFFFPERGKNLYNYL